MERDQKELKRYLRVGGALQERECGEIAVATGNPRVGHWSPGSPLGNSGVPVKKGLEWSGMERASVLPYIADRCAVIHTSE